MKGKILNRMRWSWMERGMRPFNCWLLLLLSLLSTWEGVCSQNCPVIQVSPVNTTALKVDWSSIAQDLNTINITVDQDTRSINNSSKKEEIIDKLKPGTNYIIFINAEYTNGSLKCNLTSTTNPSPVTGLSTVTQTTDSLTIEWTRPPDTRASDYTYNITVTNVMSNHTEVNKTNKDETTFTVQGLKPGDQYNILVQSVTPEDTVSSPVQVTNTTNPSPVTGLSIVTRTTDSLTIEWTKPSDTRASDYTYRITVTNVMSNHTEVNKTNKDETTFTVQGLKPGDQYNISVQSETPEDTVSSPVQVTNTTNPSPVTGLSIVTWTTDSLTIEWTKPPDTRASDYTYRITVTNVMSNHTEVNKTNKDETTFTVQGLDPGDQYNISVQSVTPEDTVSSPVQVTNTTNPSPVTGLSTVTRTNDSLTIQWTKPPDTRASDYTYRITVTNVMSNHTEVNKTNKDETKFTVQGLDPGDQYNISVQSVTPEDTVSSPVQVTNTTNPSPVTGLSTVTRTNDSLTIEWTKPPDTRASDYTYRITVTNVMSNHTEVNKTNKDKTTFTVQGLDPGDQYNISVQSVTPEDTVSSPVQVTNTTNPSPVTGLSTVTRTNDSLTIEWTKPPDTRASDYTYRITVTNVMSNHTEVNKTNKDKTTFTVQGLDPGDQYNISVQSETPEDTVSSPVQVTNTTNPSPVTGLSTVTRTNDSLTIKWTKPSDTRASDYTYRITIATPNNTLTGTKNTNKGETTFTVQGLDPGDQYNISVQSVTPEDTVSSPVQVTNTTNPLPVTGLSTVTRTNDSLTIEWTKPPDTRASDYTYRITVTNVMSNQTEVRNTNKGKTTFTEEDLKPGDQYNVSVESVTPEDTVSSPVQLTSTTNPSSVTDLSVVNRTTDSFALKWRAPTDSRASLYTYKITATSVSSRSNDKDPNNSLGRALSTKAGSTESIVTKLVPGEEYELTVQSETPEETLSAPLMVTSTTIPDTISNLHCIGSTGYMIRVEWSEPKGKFTIFTATASDGDRLVGNRTIKKDKKTFSVPDLQPGRKYTIKITTVSGQTHSKPEVEECWTSSEPIIIGATVGSLLGLILICVLLFFILYKARRQRKKQDPGSSSMGVLFSEYKPTPLSEYERYFQKKHADTDIGFAEEYQSLANVGIEQSKEASQLAENRSKNRYTNIFPYDAARVKLSPQPDSSSSDYINASYMPGYNVEKAFIAAQGPLPHTVADFWRMIWEQKSKVIVMLTNCVELNRVKCEHYWPVDKRTSVYGDIAVNIISEEVLPEWTVRNLQIEKAGCSQPRTVIQMHFTSWPDHGVPNTTDKLLQFQKFVRDYINRNQGGLPVVHCSAGVGRTGTFIGLDYLTQCMEKESLVDVYGIVRKMRMNRTCMVQTESQYIFLHQCILDMIKQKDISEPIYENQTDLIYENASAIKAAYNHNH